MAAATSRGAATRAGEGDLKDPNSVEFAWQTLALLKRL
jgi:hypothetical protein